MLCEVATKFGEDANRPAVGIRVCSCWYTIGLVSDLLWHSVVLHHQGQFRPFGPWEFWHHCNEYLSRKSLAILCLLTTVSNCNADKLGRQLFSEYLHMSSVMLTHTWVVWVYNWPQAVFWFTRSDHSVKLHCCVNSLGHFSFEKYRVHFWVFFCSNCAVLTFLLARALVRQCWITLCQQAWAPFSMIFSFKSRFMTGLWQNWVYMERPEAVFWFDISVGLWLGHKAPFGILIFFQEQNYRW